MAEKREINKSQAIRDYYNLSPKATSREVMDGLARQGIAVTIGLVNTVKSKHNQRQARRKTRRRAVEKVVAEGVVGISEIKAAFAFLKAVGSVAMAKEALAAAVEIKKVV